MDAKEFALKQHEEWSGKIEVVSRAKLETPEDLSVAYTPGVALAGGVVRNIIYLINIQDVITW